MMKIASAFAIKCVTAAAKVVQAAPKTRKAEAAEARKAAAARTSPMANPAANRKTRKNITTTEITTVKRKWAAGDAITANTTVMAPLTDIIINMAKAEKVPILAKNRATLAARPKAAAASRKKAAPAQAILKAPARLIPKAPVRLPLWNAKKPPTKANKFSWSITPRKLNVAHRPNAIVHAYAAKEAKEERARAERAAAVMEAVKVAAKVVVKVVIAKGTANLARRRRKPKKPRTKKEVAAKTRKEAEARKEVIAIRPMIIIRS